MVTSSFYLYCTHYFYAKLFPTYTAMTITTTACSIFFLHNYSLFCSQRRFSNTQFHTRLTEFLLTVAALSCLITYICLQPAEIFQCVLDFSRTLSRPLVYKHSQSWFSLMFVVVGLCEICSMYLCRVYCVHTVSWQLQAYRLYANGSI